MWEAVIALIHKIPGWYIMVVLPFLVMLVTWIFTRIRRDPHGKIYFYSQRYEDNKRNRKQDLIINKLSSMVDAIKKNRRDILQLQLCSNIPQTGKRVAYLEYSAAGFNSWADQYVVEQGLFTEEELRYIKHNNKTADSQNVFLLNGALVKSETVKKEMDL